MRTVSSLRTRTFLLTGLLILLVLVTLGPGLITRHGQHIECSAGAVGCAGQNPFDYHADDGRVEGNPGDLIVLYCQRQYRSIGVYGIDHGAGVYLVSFEADKLQAAGTAGLTADLGAKGVVSMARLPSGAYYATFKGGLVTAAGLDRYAKLFRCEF